MSKRNWSIWSREDLSQYYQGTFIGVRNKTGKVTPYLVEKVLNSMGENVCSFIGTRAGRDEVVVKFDSKRVVGLVPESTFVNLDEHCAYLSRTTARQYKKGVKASQYMTSYISLEDFRKCGVPIGKPNFNRSIVDKLFEGDFPCFELCLEKMQSGYVFSCAFHKHYCLAIKPNVKDVVLYYKGFPCGTVEQGGGIKLLDNYCDLQESIIEILG